TALTYALENNFAIRQAQQRIKEQDGLIIEVRSQALPNVSVNANYTEIDSGLSENNDFFPPTNRDWRVALNVKQTLYTGGSVSAALRAQDYLEQAVLSDLKATINQAVFQVTAGFYDVLLAREQITVQEQNIKLLEKQLQDSRNRFEAGAVSQFEVLRSEVELANAQPDLIRARNGFKLAIEELRQTLGFTGYYLEDLDKIPEFEGSLDFEPLQIDLFTALNTAKANRPELQQLDLVAKAREEGVVIEKAGKLPTLDLVGSYQYNKSSFSNRFSDSLDGWTIGLQSSWDIFDGKATDGRIQQAKAQLEQAQLNLGEATLSIEVEVRRALHDLQQAAELANASVKVIEQADESLRLANELYSAGRGTQLDVLQSQVALTESRLNQLQAYHSYKIAEASLARSLGNAIPYVEAEK
ncbi:MAG: TolC family protein, partial [Verrucomicrobiae bacterium]|nr:TolC family protein [Verrucomicrobiae bacterium]